MVCTNHYAFLFYFYSQLSMSFPLKLKKNLIITIQERNNSWKIYFAYRVILFLVFVVCILFLSFCQELFNPRMPCSIQVGYLHVYILYVLLTWLLTGLNAEKHLHEATPVSTCSFPSVTSIPPPPHPTPPHPLPSAIQDRGSKTRALPPILLMLLVSVVTSELQCHLFIF